MEHDLVLEYINRESEDNSLDNDGNNNSQSVQEIEVSHHQNGSVDGDGNKEIEVEMIAHDIDVSNPGSDFDHRNDTSNPNNQSSGTNNSKDEDFMVGARGGNSSSLRPSRSKKTKAM